MFFFNQQKIQFFRLDADSLLISVRRAVNNYTYVNVKFSNIVCPDDDVYNLVVNSDVVKRYHVCFYHYMKQFVFDLIEIEEFSRGLTELREFVRHIKKSADLYGKFRRLVRLKNKELKHNKFFFWKFLSVRINQRIFGTNFISDVLKFQLSIFVPKIWNLKVN